MASLFESLRHTIFINNIVFLTVFSNVRCGLLARKFVLISCSQSQYNFFSSFTISFLCSYFSVYHSETSGNNPFSIAYFTTSTSSVFSCLLTYSDPASFLHPGKRGWTASLSSRHIWHLSSSFTSLIFLHAFVSIISSCNGNLWCYPGVSITFQPPKVVLKILLRYFTLQLLLYKTSLFVSFLSFDEDQLQFLLFYFPFCISLLASYYYYYYYCHHYNYYYNYLFLIFMLWLLLLPS